MKWIRSQAAHRHRLQPQSSLCGGENMLPVYSATFFLACYLFYFFLDSPAPPPSSAIMSAQIRQLWGLLTMPTLQAVRKLRGRSMARHTLPCPPQNGEVLYVVCPSGVVKDFYYRLPRGRPRELGHRLTCVNP